MTNWNTIDSIIFDMDGTLWDAIESYSTIWNICSTSLGVNREICREDLIGFMGKPIDAIFSALFAENKELNTEQYITTLDAIEDEMMPNLGGDSYPHMEQCIESLAKHYRLFMISNCGKNGLKHFMNFTGITPHITDTLTFGGTLKQKGENIKALIAKHNLKGAIYMGDTQGDCDETHRAGIPFAYATYGFGSCTNADIEFNSFKEFADYFLKLKAI